MAQQVTVAVARFEDLVAIGLTALIQGDPTLDLVADRIEPGALESTIAEHAPRVAVLNFGSLEGAAEVFHLHQHLPSTRFVVLANRPSAAECNQMLAIGATACLSKQTEGRDVINGIHLAARGVHVLPPAGGSGGDMARDIRGAELLTPREADVLSLLQEGATNAQIAHELTIGMETVRTHARNIYRKLGIASRRDLVRPRPPARTLDRV